AAEAAASSGAVGGSGGGGGGGSGGITITTSSRDRQFRIEVADTGIGIEPELMPRLFDAFEQGEQATARRFGGLGLGLSIVKSLVEMHNGTITAASEGPGRGATFTIILPTVPAPQDRSTPTPSVTDADN